MKINGRSNYSAGTKDECQTPPYGVMPLRKILNIFFLGATVWEPAPGKGFLSKGLQRLGHKVIETNDDFLEYDRPPLGVNVIVTNPPFSSKLKREFIKQCENFRQKFRIPWALLMVPTTVGELLVWKEMQNVSLYVPMGRINFHMPEKGWGTPEKPTTATFNTVWFVKGIGGRGVYHDDFEMGPNHFRALERWQEYLKIPSNNYK